MRLERKSLSKSSRQTLLDQVRPIDPGEFFTENQGFSFGCAAITHYMIRQNRPARVIEVGSGNSSLIISSALQRNSDDGGEAYEYTVIDPLSHGSGAIRQNTASTDGQEGRRHRPQTAQYA